MKFRKMIAFLLASAICFGMFSVGAFAADAKKGVSFSKTKITMTLGSVYTLKPVLTGVENKTLQWSSSDKSVASVTSEGVITAKKTGSAEITVKVKGTSYSAVCKVKVRLPKTAAELANSMGAGWSLMNSFDIYGANWIEDIRDYETVWGNPKVSASLVKAIKKAGFQTIRISVRWREHMDANGVISEEWLDRIQEVVDYAYNRDMYVILNSHDAWISVKNEKSERKIFRRMWLQIAERFQDYDEKLIFEGMDDLFCIDEGESGFPISARGVLYRLHDDFIKSVRKSGGKNEKRFLIVIPADFYGAFKDPQDDRVLVGLSNFAPFDFMDEDADKRTFTEEGKQQVDAQFEEIDRYFLSKGYSVVITQWGSRDKGNTAERIKAAKYFLAAAKERKIPCVWAPWLDRLIDLETLEWDSPKLVRAITN